MSTGIPAVDDLALELGCCADCLAAGPEDAEPKCRDAVMTAFHEVYGTVPFERLRTRIYLDGGR